MCKCCFGSVKGESCGWPKGTVRATIALVTIPLGFVSALGIMGILLWKEQYEAAIGVSSAVWAVIGTIVGYYFGSKQAEGAAKLIQQSEHELIESRNLEIGLISRGRYIPDNSVLPV